MANDWFTESGSSDFEIRYRLKKLVYLTQSPFQTIKILDTYQFDKILILDGAIQTSEKDEFIYHEMIAHVPMLTHPAPRNVLIIGGGDGGALRRVLEHNIQKVLLVEIDEQVIKACQSYLPSISQGAFSHNKVRIIYEDGAEFVKKCHAQFDIIIVDSTDPISNAKALFTKEFYSNCFNILTSQGILVTQSGSPIFQMPVLQDAYCGLEKFFTIVKPYLTFVPTYPGVLWSFTMGSKSIDPTQVDQQNITKIIKNINTQYYTPQIHTACFVLPKFIQQALK